MGACCSAKPHDPCPAFQPSLGQHHSVLVHPGTCGGTSTSYNVVYRPPHMNQRLAPGEARPKFWLSPTLSCPQSPPIVSIAWTQQHPASVLPAPCVEPSSHSQQLVQPPQQGRPEDDQKLQRQQQQQQQQQECENVELQQQMSQDQQKQRTGRRGIRLKNPARRFRWRHLSRTSDNSCHGPEDTRPEAGIPSLTDRYLFIRAYPPFLLPYVEKVLRLRLVFTDPTVEKMVGEYGHLRHGSLEDEISDPMMEISHLVRNVHSLKVVFRHSSTLQGLPDMTVIESHGGVKRLRRLRYRSMPVTWIDLDHRKPHVKAVGEQFELTVGPLGANLTPEDFHDGNGERPALLGTYERALDTSPDRRLLFSVRLYRWFNQAAPSECLSDLSDICEQGSPQLGGLGV